MTSADLARIVRMPKSRRRKTEAIVLAHERMTAVMADQYRVPARVPRERLVHRSFFERRCLKASMNARIAVKRIIAIVAHQHVARPMSSSTSAEHLPVCRRAVRGINRVCASERASAGLRQIVARAPSRAHEGHLRI